MKSRVAFVSTFLLIPLAACGGGEDVAMPELTAKRLDVALSDLERAGYGDEPEILGGGVFGVVDESNWTVCEQDPAPDELITDEPRLTVDRSCDNLQEPEEAPIDEADPGSAASEPAPATDEEIWAANYADAQDAYVGAVAAALSPARAPELPASVPLDSCGLLKKDLAVGARTSKAAQAFDLRRTPTAAQVFDAIAAATTYVCPELAKRHQTQVSDYVRAERAAAQQALRKQRRDEARKRREERRRAAFVAPSTPADVYYANCTEVENAGAAPIYAGQPGYSSSLDRDGDGVACEQ